MKEKELKISIAGNEYKFLISEDNEIIAFTFYRNNKIQSSSAMESIAKDKLKLYLSEKLLIMAMYDINHEIAKFDLAPIN